MLTRVRHVALAIVIALGAVARTASGDDIPSMPSTSADAAGSGSDTAPVDDFPDRIPGLEFVHFQSHLQVHTFGGADLSLPRGYYMDEGKYGEIDAHVKDVENQNTRLTAENESYKASLSDWRPGWMTMLAVAALGFGAGFIAAEKL